MEKATVKNVSKTKRRFMSDQILLEKEKMRAESPTGVAVKTEDQSAACPMQGKGWLKGGIMMAVCCAAPLLVLGAIALFGLSLGALASGFFSIAALLACPVGMYLMMRMMSKDKQ
jgi:hypothetical protein